MFKYKREINNYEQARQIEYSLTDNSKICFCTTGTLYTKKPYHGMYIKNGRVLLENIVETFDVDGNTYRMVEIDTNSKDMNTKDAVKLIYDNYIVKETQLDPILFELFVDFLIDIKKELIQIQKR